MVLLVLNCQSQRFKKTNKQKSWKNPDNPPSRHELRSKSSVQNLVSFILLLHQIAQFGWTAALEVSWFFMDFCFRVTERLRANDSQV